MTINSVLIANRGAIAVRIARTLRRLHRQSIAVYAEDDVDSAHIDACDVAVCLGPGTASETYLNQERLLQIADENGANAIHPGYGFLSENADFERRCAEVGIAFLGPTAEQIEVFGRKHSARQLAVESGVPLLVGSDLVETVDAAIEAAEKIGYPVILKSTAGGGGIGMRQCEDAISLQQAFYGVKRLAEDNFGDAGVFVEQYVTQARHVEVQVIGDGRGRVLAVGDRDCSLQRRQQKVIEECPAPCLPEDIRAKLHESARNLLANVNYRGVGTVEFIYDEKRRQAAFLEVNTRLQVEHGVTEMVYGIDLVEWMVRLAEGSLPDIDELEATLSSNGHAMQARIYAEDPAEDFRPSPGLITHAAFPAGSAELRVDTWVSSGSQVSPSFDPLLAKVIAHGCNREASRTALLAALGDTLLYGTQTNLAYLRQIMVMDEFVEARLNTRLLHDVTPHAATIRVLSGGTMTTVQDWPGRTGYWHVGVPPSGPFDDLSFRLGNLLLGNEPGVPGLEMTVSGPDLLIGETLDFVLTGAKMLAMLDGRQVRHGCVTRAPAGSRLSIGKVDGAGIRTYLLVAGGIACPDYLGSAATFTLGQFGGHCGRALSSGDVLQLTEKGRSAEPGRTCSMSALAGTDSRQLHVVYGPHGAPDFFTNEDIDTLFETEYEVHFNSSRTGIRLIGPKPAWARESGGEAGLHPSNIHDNAYAIGTVDFTGDMPVILGPDGPSLGGFVCPATVIRADRWKLGQLRPGDHVRFVPVTIEEALERQEEVGEWLSQIRARSPTTPFTPATVRSSVRPDPVLEVCESTANPELRLVFRPSGDDYLLIELGEQVLDLTIRVHIQALYERLEADRHSGMLELTPGIRSLQIHYVPEQISITQLIERVRAADADIGDIDSIEIPSRVVHLPLSFDDPVCHEAVEKYMRVVRPNAPWCPNNLDFIRRINGLDSIDEVRDFVFAADYVVLGLGDVYLGAPVATPLDPRQRLVTTKYNPARTWTAENSVGIGGAYLCIYGMEGPGGYQFVGRTLQVWNRYRQTKAFENPWLLRFFDQIRFYPVSAQELPVLRDAFIRGRYTPEITPTTFSLREQRAYVEGIDEEIKAFRDQRESAFRAELQDWQAKGLLTFEESVVLPAGDPDGELSEGLFAVQSHVAGNVWQVTSEPGDTVQDGDTLVILESMKMELEVKCTGRGTVVEMLVEPGQQITAGQRLVVLESAEK